MLSQHYRVLVHWLQLGFLTTVLLIFVLSLTWGIKGNTSNRIEPNLGLWIMGLEIFDMNCSWTARQTITSWGGHHPVQSRRLYAGACALKAAVHYAAPDCSFQIGTKPYEKRPVLTSLFTRWAIPFCPHLTGLQAPIFFFHTVGLNWSGRRHLASRFCSYWPIR